MQACEAGQAIRGAGAAALHEALCSARRDTLATFAAFERALDGLAVPRHETLNPPLWELGHVGWFQEYWIGRNTQCHLGPRADPDAPRSGALRADADALYDSSRVAHASRWSLPLPDAAATRNDLQEQLEATLARLGTAEADDAGLYFFRLALLHEDMHHEAALYMAQHLGIAIDDARWQAAALPGHRTSLDLDGGRVQLGRTGSGFAFDNELPAWTTSVAPVRIDAQPVRWSEYLPFVEDGGYRRTDLWSAAGRDWLAATAPLAPRYLRRLDGHWQQWRHGAWGPLDPALAACHLTYFEAQAWCRWAGRSLPTEAQWEHAARRRPDDFLWGQVWEWTSSSFAPYPGFVAHPYRDYSAPWFGTRQVLRGASFLTQPRLRSVCYRNFFAAHRNDIAAGFRSCAA